MGPQEEPLYTGIQGDPPRGCSTKQSLDGLCDQEMLSFQRSLKSSKAWPGTIKASTFKS